MKTVALIGLGRIAEAYKSGLASSKTLRLVAVCDSSPDAIALPLYEGLPIYTDYKEMIEAEKPEYVIVATPPKTHLEIASYAANHGIGVFMEKPAVVDRNELYELIKLKESAKAPIIPMFHWQHSAEIMEFCRTYDPSQINDIKVSVKDPYSTDGKSIDTNRLGLMGCWLDSGINILSYLTLLLPFNSVEITDRTYELCETSKQLIFFDVKLIVDGIPVQITIDWRKGKEEKKSVFSYSDRNIVLFHSRQSVEDGNTLVSFKAQNRLSHHYLHLFNDPFSEVENTNLIKIYEILFELGDVK